MSQVRPGTPAPLGAASDGEGTNFAIFSENATGVELCLFDNPDDANAFQESVQAAGGFDGILRDLASYNDEVPFLGWDNPLGGVDDWALDQLGVDDNDAGDPPGVRR